MIRHNKILVPTDFSEQSTEALRRAGKLAEKFDAEVHLLHLMEPSLYFETDMVSISPLDEVDDEIHHGHFQQLKEQAKACGFPVVLHVKEAVGDPARTICKFADTLPADLIVIGRHDEKGVIKHMLMGSTVERVVAHAACSVLVTMPHDFLKD